MTENAVSTVDAQALTPSSDGAFTLAPRTLEDAYKFAAIVSKSDLVPKDYRGKEANCLIAMQMGMELGLPPLQAIQNIAVVNGRPAIWGDLLPALARRASDFEYLNESFDEDSMTATCEGKRRNQPAQARTFSEADAKTAGLWGKEGPWRNYPKRMLQMRARAYLIRDMFPDALRGIAVREEAIDIEVTDYSDVTPTKGKPAVSMPQARKGAAANKAARAAVGDDVVDGEFTVDPANPDATPRPAEKAAPPQVEAKAGGALTDGMLKTVRAKLTGAGIEENALFAHFEVGGFEDLTRGQINDVLGWISEQSS